MGFEDIELLDDFSWIYTLTFGPAGWEKTLQDTADDYFSALEDLKRDGYMTIDLNRENISHGYGWFLASLENGRMSGTVADAAEQDDSVRERLDNIAVLISRSDAGPGTHARAGLFQFLISLAEDPDPGISRIGKALQGIFGFTDSEHERYGFPVGDSHVINRMLALLYDGNDELFESFFKVFDTLRSLRMDSWGQSFETDAAFNEAESLPGLVSLLREANGSDRAVVEEALARIMGRLGSVKSTESVGQILREVNRTALEALPDGASPSDRMRFTVNPLAGVASGQHTFFDVDAWQNFLRSRVVIIEQHPPVDPNEMERYVSDAWDYLGNLPRELGDGSDDRLIAARSLLVLANRMESVIVREFLDLLRRLEGSNVVNTVYALLHAAAARENYSPGRYDLVRSILRLIEYGFESRNEKIMGRIVPSAIVFFVASPIDYRIEVDLSVLLDDLFGLGNDSPDRKVLPYAEETAHDFLSYLLHHPRPQYSEAAHFLYRLKMRGEEGYSENLLALMRQALREDMLRGTDRFDKEKLDKILRPLFDPDPAVRRLIDRVSISVEGPNEDFFDNYERTIRTRTRRGNGGNPSGTTAPPAPQVPQVPSGPAATPAGTAPSTVTGLIEVENEPAVVHGAHAMHNGGRQAQRRARYGQTQLRSAQVAVRMPAVAARPMQTVRVVP